MNWRRICVWPWCRRVDDHTVEGQTRLDVMDTQDAEIQQLGRELRAQNRQNNFGPMVAEAIRRAPREGT